MTNLKTKFFTMHKPCDIALLKSVPIQAIGKTGGDSPVHDDLFFANQRASKVSCQEMHLL